MTALVSLIFIAMIPVIDCKLQIFPYTCTCIRSSVAHHTLLACVMMKFLAKYIAGSLQMNNCNIMYVKG